MPYCLYLRKSRADVEAEAHGEGETLARHEKLLLEIAKRGNYNITQIYREVVSGDTIAARPVMRQLLSEIWQGMWEGVLVVEVERLARGDTADQGAIVQAFKYTGTRIITPSKVYDPSNEFDEEYFEFGLFMSRREYKAINRRLQRGRVAACQEGKYVGGLAPFGYEKVKIPDGKGWTLRIKEDEAAVVRYIFNTFAEGEQQPDGTSRHVGVTTLANRLSDKGIPAPSGLPSWNGGTVRMILLNPVYIGKVRWKHSKPHRVSDGTSVRVSWRRSDEGSLVFDGIHPPIVSEGLFNKAAAVMHSGPARVRSNFELTNPLAGILRCGGCGSSMRLINRFDRPQFAGYNCPNRMCHVPGSNAALVEERILEKLSEWLEEYRLDLASGSSAVEGKKVSAAESQLRAAQAKVLTLRKRLTGAHERLEDGVYDVDTFLRRSKEISDQIAAAEAAVSFCESELSHARKQEMNRNSFIPRIEEVLKAYHALPDAAAKNRALRAVIDHVDYFREKRAYRGGPLDDFELELYPALPKE